MLIFLECDKQPMESMNVHGEMPSEWYSSPTWSPTGEWIAYEHYAIDSLFGIWLVRPDGSDAHFETRGTSPDFSPDGKKLALAGIFVYDLVTKKRTQLTFEGNNVFPSWSPNGENIAYHSMSGSPPLMIMDANGGNRRPLLPLEHNHGARPKWFPDYRILFIRGTRRENKNTVDIFAIDTTGQNLVQLTNSGESNSESKVSPDGKRISWERWERNKATAVWMMNVDGSKKMRLTDGLEPAWAPDGQHIIFRKRGDYVVGQHYNDYDPKVHGSLWVMNVNTREQWKLLPTACGN